MPRLFPAASHTTIYYMTVWFGINDASNGRHHVPLDEYKENLIDILLHLLEKFGVENTRLLLICPSPIAEPVAMDRRNVRRSLFLGFKNLVRTDFLL